MAFCGTSLIFYMLQYTLFNLLVLSASISALPVYLYGQYTAPVPSSVHSTTPDLFADLYNRTAYFRHPVSLVIKVIR